MIKPLLDFARRHIILFGTAKFGASFVMGFALGVYILPILTAEKGLDTAALAQLEASAERSDTLTCDLPGSAAFHWGEGTVRASDMRIWLEVKIPPGPDYRLYLKPSLTTDEASLLKIKDQSVQVGEVRLSVIPDSMCRSASRLAIIRRCWYGEAYSASSLPWPS